MIRLIKYLEKSFSLQKKVIVIFILLSIIPTILITVIANAIYSKNILEQAYELVEQNAKQHSSMVRERMDQYENVLYELVSDKVYIDIAHEINVGEPEDIIAKQSNMEILLRDFVYTYDGIRSVTFLADNNEYASYSKWYGSSHEMIWSDAKERREIHDEIKKQQRLTFMAMVNLSNNQPKNDYVILMGFPIKNLRTKQQSGVLVIALEQEVLLFKDNQTSNGGISTLIVDEDEHIMAGAGDGYINQKLDTFIKGEYGKRKITREINPIDGTKWRIINIIDTLKQREDINYFTAVVFILMAVIICIFFFVVYKLTHKYLYEIQSIVKGIRAYDGTSGESSEIELQEKDELYIIAKQFNKMTKRVNSLVETLKQRNVEIKVAAENQKHAEIKALEAQINPHFLFNTLDSINWRAIEHDEEEISDMLGALGSLLRYSVSNIAMVVVLEAEIEWLKKYIFLQRDRFQNSFDCIYNITNEAMAFPIYKMLLQPIVENTILHAFEEVKSGGLIQVEAFVKEGNRLQITIKDNGCGMSKERLAEIRHEINGSGALNSKSIGISNVIHRLRIYYHEEAQIEINSVLGKGTEVTLIIPDHSEEG